MKISIITDGNSQLGLGHIYQSLSLANLLKKNTHHDIVVNFITKSDKNINDLITSSGFEVLRFDNDDLIFNYLNTYRPDKIIFDKLDVDPLLAKNIKEILKTKLIICTNLTEANLYADLTVLADIGSNFKNITKRDSISKKVEFFGPKFWLLRPEFYELNNSNKIKKNDVQDIMLIFGGSDPSNISSKVLNELLQMDEKFNIVLVLGASFAHRNELNLVLNQNQTTKSHVVIAENIKNVAEIMHKSDVVFASPGLSFFEALAVGTPVIGFHQNELQKEVYAEVLPTMDVAELHKLPSIIKNKSFLYPHDPLIKSMEIGAGKDDIISEILK